MAGDEAWAEETESDRYSCPSPTAGVGPTEVGRVLIGLVRVAGMAELLAGWAVLRVTKSSIRIEWVSRVEPLLPP